MHKLHIWFAPPNKMGRSAAQNHVFVSQLYLDVSAHCRIAVSMWMFNSRLFRIAKECYQHSGRALSYVQHYPWLCSGASEGKIRTRKHYSVMIEIAHVKCI